MDKETKKALSELKDSMANIYDNIRVLSEDVAKLDNRLITNEIEHGKRNEYRLPVEAQVPVTTVIPVPFASHGNPVNDAWTSPFEGHLSYHQMPNKIKEDPRVMMGMVFNPDPNANDFDFDFPVCICGDGVYTIDPEDNNYMSKVDLDVPVFVGTEQRPTGMYVPFSVSREGAVDAMRFIDLVIDAHDSGDGIGRAPIFMNKLKG